MTSDFFHISCRSSYDSGCCCCCCCCRCRKKHAKYAVMQCANQTVSKVLDVGGCLVPCLMQDVAGRLMSRSLSRRVPRWSPASRSRLPAGEPSILYDSGCRLSPSQQQQQHRPRRCAQRETTHRASHHRRPYTPKERG
jgi:hypothetical protein